ncbi:MAG: hypothetical protein EOP07_24030 [Proteobacteria bacterium]|nr:MAG: hypothetical protein EOP07_24030 [Pseudomonadota bacterium]
MEAYPSSRDLFGSEDAVSLDGLGGGDVRGEHCYYVASKNIKGKGEVVFVVRSDGVLLHVTKQEGNIYHFSDGSIVRDLCVPHFRSWSDDSILKFVDGNETAKPLAELYNQARTILKKMIFIDENNLGLLAVVAISSFFVSMAKATPFIHFRAPEPNTGKTHAMMSLLKLCFNSSKGEETAVFGKASQSSIFRSLAQSRGVVAFDDLEVINNTKSTPLRVGMLVGYKKQSAIQTLMERGKRSFR